jgi:DNA-binding MarR family transcriptional regulator
MPEDVAARVGYRVKQAQNALRKAMDEVLAGIGITAPQYAVLSAVEADPGLSSAALARAAFVTAQTMQGIVANLEREGFLARAPDPDHGRIMRAALTPRGRAALRRAHAAVADIEARMFEGLLPAEVERLGTMLARVAENLRKPPGDDADFRSFSVRGRSRPDAT